MSDDVLAWITLFGRIFIHANIRLVTGLHIGAQKSELAIGGVDNPVIRDVLTNRPYIPGSSLRGKMRSLAEKISHAPLTSNIGTPNNPVRIHIARNEDDYRQYWVNPVFGVPAEIQFEIGAPTRLIVRDVFLSDASAEALETAETDQPFTEIKTEVSIDRITSAANPRPMERVPAGVIFEGLEMVYSVYEKADLENFRELLRTMRLLEDDYLGGQGSRGSGKIAFESLLISARDCQDYSAVHYFSDQAGNANYFGTLDELLGAQDDVIRWLASKISAS